MNCLIVTPHRYGIREVAERVGDAWERLGHDVSYILDHGDAARIGPIKIGIPGIARWWYRQFRALTRDPTAYDLIWTHQPLIPLLPTRDPALWNRVVVTVHTTYCGEYRLTRSGEYPRHLRGYYRLATLLESRGYRSLESLACRGPQFTVVAPHLREELSDSGVDPRGTAYVPNGLPTPEDTEFAPIKSTFGVPPDATVVFSIGSLTRQKRPETLVEAANEVTRRREDVWCVIAGDGPFAETVERTAGERVLVLGHVTETKKWRWFADADVFLSLSAYEGMPVATLEALSMGVPVVLSDIPAHRHVVEQYGRVGTVTDLDSVAVTRAVTRVSGVSVDVTLPDWQKIATQYLDLAPRRAGDQVRDSPG